MNGREQESILWWFLYSPNLTGMILFPSFKVWCHYPHFTDEETDWKAQNHISYSMEDLWYLIKSLSFETYISFHWTSCFQTVFKDHCQSRSFQRVYEAPHSSSECWFVAKLFSYTSTKIKCPIRVNAKADRRTQLPSDKSDIKEICKNVKQSHSSCYFLILKSYFS